MARSARTPTSEGENGHPATALAVSPSASNALACQWEAQIQLVKDTCCKPKNREATDAEFGLFLHQCRTRRLDPLTRQIYAIFRNAKEGDRYVEKMTIQTSIDGFRLTAQRTGEYRGQAGPFWCGEDGVWMDVWTQQVPPVAAKVGAWREGFKEPVWGVARYDQYAQFFERNGKQFPTGQWGKMPDTMTAKCAEALALRKAFPDELSGLYTGDEMQQADKGDDAEPEHKPAKLSAKVEPIPAAPTVAETLVGPEKTTKQKLWGAIKKWVDLPAGPEQAAKLADAAKRIYSWLNIAIDGKATEPQLAGILTFVEKKLAEKVVFAEWLANPDGEKAAKKPAFTVGGDIQEDDIPF